MRGRFASRLSEYAATPPPPTSTTSDEDYTIFLYEVASLLAWLKGFPTPIVTADYGPRLAAAGFDSVVTMATAEPGSLKPSREMSTHRA